MPKLDNGNVCIHNVLMSGRFKSHLLVRHSRDVVSYYALTQVFLGTALWLHGEEDKLADAVNIVRWHRRRFGFK